MQCGEDGSGLMQDIAAIRPMMDGTSEPHHRFAPLPPPALVSQRVSRLRSLFELSSGQQQTPPRRRRSVRFEQYPDTSSAIDQFDGQIGERLAPYDELQGPETSGLSQSAVECLEELTLELNLDAASR